MPKWKQQWLWSQTGLGLNAEVSAPSLCGSEQEPWAISLRVLVYQHRPDSHHTGLFARVRAVFPMEWNANPGALQTLSGDAVSQYSIALIKASERYYPFKWLPLLSAQQRISQATDQPLTHLSWPAALCNKEVAGHGLRNVMANSPWLECPNVFFLCFVYVFTLTFYFLLSDPGFSLNFIFNISFKLYA